MSKNNEDNEDDLYKDLYGADDDEPEVSEAAEHQPRRDESPTSTVPVKPAPIPVKADDTPALVPPKPPINPDDLAGHSRVAASAYSVPMTQPQGNGLPANPNPGPSLPVPSLQVGREQAYERGGRADRNEDGSSNTNSSLVAPLPSALPTIVSSINYRAVLLRKMFVGGLNWDTTDEGLRHYFSEFGKVDSCTIMRDPSGRSRGFAFLTFEDPASVNAVMVREHYLDGKIIDPKRAIPRTEHTRTQKLFVGGLAPSVTNDSMRQFFSQYGKVIDATVMVDRDSSRSKGFGFVTFEDAGAAEKLLGMPGLEIEGKMVEIKMAQPRTGGQLREGQFQTREYDNRGGGFQGGSFTNGANGGGGSGGGGGGGGGGGTGQTPFDPQALATLYQRMYTMNQGAWGGGMGMNMMGGGLGGGVMGMNPMMGNGGMMGMNAMPATGGMMGGAPMGRGMGMMGGGGQMGMGAAGMMGGGAAAGGSGMVGGMMGRGGAIPRGPAAMRGSGATGMAQGMAGANTGAGPTRFNRGQNNYHPYSR